MADNKQKPTNADKRFVDMDTSEKMRFIGKALVFFVSGGFLFPTLWID
jgi:hypothetical protein